MFFTGIFSKDQSIIVSDHKSHCIYEHYIHKKTLAILLGDSCKYSYEGGPLEKVKVASPVALSFLESTPYTA